jgi:hypothetical protein
MKNYLINHARSEFSMNVNIESFIMLAGAVLVGTGFLSQTVPSSQPGFNYNSATALERTQFLEISAKRHKDYFSPSYVSKNKTYKFGGRSITYVYNAGLSKLLCDTDESCDVLQCRRYLQSELSAQNILVRLKYLNAKERPIGSQVLRNATCEAVISDWESNLDS